MCLPCSGLCICCYFVSLFFCLVCLLGCLFSLWVVWHWFVCVILLDCWFNLAFWLFCVGVDFGWMVTWMLFCLFWCYLLFVCFVVGAVDCCLCIVIYMLFLIYCCDCFGNTAICFDGSLFSLWLAVIVCLSVSLLWFGLLVFVYMLRYLLFICYVADICWLWLLLGLVSLVNLMLSWFV